MDRMWAPWRIELIKSPKKPGCFFCDYIEEDDDEGNLVLERGERSFVLMNRYPYNNGHLMVAPWQHTGELCELDAKTRAEMMEFVVRWQKVLDLTISPHGYNIGINLGDSAGAGVKDHVHIHIVPRWNGDTNFMPAIGDTKVIPQSLDDLYQQMLSNLPKLGEEENG